MSIVPSKTVDLLQFFEDRVQPTKPWATNATNIGLVAGDVTALNTKVTAARAAYDAQQAAKNAAKAATQALKDAVRDVSIAGSEALKKIKAKGMSDPNAYVLAQVPAPGTPSPVGPPGTAYGLVATLLPDGSLGTKWKCPQPAGAVGTQYQISRRLGATGPLVFIATVGKRSFVDATVPAGTAQVTYEIVAQRSTARGIAQEFTVRFGVSSSGEMTATAVAAAPSPRMAA